MSAKARIFAKFVATLGVGASSGYLLAVQRRPSGINEDFLIKPPTFADLEPKPVAKPRRAGDIDWGPVVQWDNNWDQRHPRTDDEKSKRTATRHLLLIRHGQYNIKGQTDAQRYLTDLGREQAVLTGKRIAQLNLPLTYLVCSTMTRAQQTAGLMRQSLPETLTIKSDDPILAEGAPYPPEPPNRSWNPEDKYFADGARIESAFRKYFHRADVDQDKDSYEVIVCHANVIRYFVCRALQLPPEAWLRMSLKHASITWVTIRPSGKVSIRGVGEAGHFPPEKLTTS